MDIEMDAQLEAEIEANLPHCVRLYHHDNDTGGFFVAQLRHKPEATPQNVARSFVPKRFQNPDSGWVPLVLDQPRPNRHSIFPAPTEIIEEVQQRYGISDSDWSWWHRGKRLNIAPKLVEERIFNQQCPNKRGNLWPAGTFHPLKLIHVGLPAFTQEEKNLALPPRVCTGTPKPHDSTNADLAPDTLRRMLQGWAPLMEEYTTEFGPLEEVGPVLMSCTLPCWTSLCFRLGWRKVDLDDRSNWQECAENETRYAARTRRRRVR